jgi:flagellin
MDSDIKGFQQITDSLNLGSSTVEVARAASEQVTNLLNNVKAKIVAAQEQNVDRAAIQRDIDALKGQVTSIIDSAQFNGLNLLKGGDDVNVLSSLNRSAGGTVSTTDITVTRADLRLVEGVAGTTTAVTATEAGDITLSNSGSFADGVANTITIAADGGSTSIAGGYTFNIDLGGASVQYIAAENDTINDVAQGLSDALQERFAEMEANSPGSAPDVTISLTLGTDPSTQDAVINVTTNSGGPLAVTSSVYTDGTAGGDLGRLNALDINTADETIVDQALLDIEDMISDVIDATASFGSVQNRIDIQNDFVTSLISSLQSGVSSLTDANLEEASARLQALQVQQQLNIQALSIANAAPQALLALFR